MVELRSLLPVREIVTPLAIWTQIALVHVLVARDAVLRKPQVGSGLLCALDQSPQGGDHVRDRVTLLAVQPGVLSLKGITGLAMIE